MDAVGILGKLESDGKIPPSSLVNPPDTKSSVRGDGLLTKRARVATGVGNQPKTGLCWHSSELFRRAGDPRLP